MLDGDELADNQTNANTYRGNVFMGYSDGKPQTGQSPDALRGQKLSELVVEQDRMMLERLLARIQRRGRLDNIGLRFKGPDGPTPLLNLNGYHIEDLGAHSFLALRMAPYIANFFLLPVFTRHMPESEFGIVSLLNSFSAFFLCFLGLQLGSTPTSAQRPSRLEPSGASMAYG